MLTVGPKMVVDAGRPGWWGRAVGLGRGRGDGAELLWAVAVGGSRHRVGAGWGEGEVEEGKGEKEETWALRSRFDVWDMIDLEVWALRSG